MMLSPVVVGLFWNYLLNPNWGIVDYLLNVLFRIPKNRVAFPEKIAIFGVGLADTWMWSPFMFLFCHAGISAIPKYSG